MMSDVIITPGSAVCEKGKIKLSGSISIEILALDMEQDSLYSGADDSL